MYHHKFVYKSTYLWNNRQIWYKVVKLVFFPIFQGKKKLLTSRLSVKLKTKQNKKQNKQLQYE